MSEHRRHQGTVVIAVILAGVLFDMGRAAETTSRRILVCGARTAIVEIDQAHPEGKVEWSYPSSSREGWVLPGGNVLLALSASETTPKGAAVEVVPGGKESDGTTIANKIVWRYDGTQAEVNSVQKTAEGTYVITEAGPNPRLLELDAAGGIVNEFALNCQKANAHMQSRMARKQTDGTFLVPHLLDFAVVRYDRKGKEISRFNTHVTGEPAVNSWPFTAIALADGGILVGLTNGNRVIEFDPQGKVRWQITSDDVGGIINDACGVQRLPSGNTMITSYHIGQGGVRLLEITPEKKLVWTWKADVPAVHHFQVLAIDGKALENSSLR